jgi:hypothetical protein
MASTGHVRAAAASRAVVVAAEGTGAAALAHWWAGGTLPDSSYLLGMAAVVFAGAMLVLTRTTTVALAGVLAVAAQAGLHVVATASSAAHPMQMRSGHEMATAAPGPGMLLAHGLTAVVVTLLLVLQDQAARRLGFAARFGDLMVAVPLLRTAGPVRAGETRRNRPLHPMSPHRGPPAPVLTS